MTYIKVSGVAYPAEISGLVKDKNWDERESKTVKLAMTYSSANSLFTHNAKWSVIDDDGVEYDNSEYRIAGDITDHRNGTVSVKMGKMTELESAYAMLLGGAE